ncbi:hypothetical protein CXG81DRAFT_11532 [Caulochytrium protostelioides]|uniref:Mitochondrial glyco protein n=1 Tax=Caulochytrium protostelioides TaxID=1555241 RepID=A0A4P9X9V2_9FUNG|nr:hypothetical protein CXG81DRAFT_11532 [Caulochytrium protostelioides]|eukprot:RKP01801.1 hypothetical protein CXG81DRAFT_11532 [Caulochytrium protostelioides]
MLAVTHALRLSARRAVGVSAFQPARTFMVSALARGRGVTDTDLQHALRREFEYEQTSTTDPSSPDSERVQAQAALVKEFLAKGVWDVVDKPGSKEVSFVRTFGNEKITVLVDTDMRYEENEGAFEENEEGEESDAEALEEAPAPKEAIVTVEKEGSNEHLELTLGMDGDYHEILHVGIYPNTAGGDTAEADWQRRGAYSGPVYNQLDENLIDIWENWVEERGVDTGFVAAVNAYIEQKEQKEYAKWLKRVSDWVAK